MDFISYANVDGFCESSHNYDSVFTFAVVLLVAIAFGALLATRIEKTEIN